MTYLLFVGDYYYPNGGWKDFVDSFSSLKDAQVAAARECGDWWHIVDTDIGNGTMVDSGRRKE